MQENNVRIQAEGPQSSEVFGNVPNNAESFGSLPNDAERFRTVPKVAERKENHTLTVREVARLFEVAGVARTERSITNWCQPNKSGIARLDAYFDPNERRYLITPQSVELAIQEEMARMTKINAPSESTRNVPKTSERPEPGFQKDSEADSGRVRALEQEVIDLKITNKGKDYFIAQLRMERDGFAQERQEYVEKLTNASRKVGELETRLLQLEAPPDDRS